MTLYARVKPDRLGRPHSLWVSGELYRLLEGASWGAAREGDLLVLRRGEGGFAFSKTSHAARMPWLLDEFNADGQLTNEPFAVKRNGTSTFLFDIGNPNPHLASRGRGVGTSMPMRIVDSGLHQKQQYSAEEFIRLFALATIARDEEITAQALQTPDDLLAKLPGQATINSRFGTLKRLLAFTDYQVQRLRRSGMNAQEAHEALLEMLG